MVAGYHLIWTIYGWWLPNDPRGSTSREVRSAAIAGLGELHYGRKRVQPAASVMRDFHAAARAVLKHTLRELSAVEIQAVGAAFADVMRACKYTCYGCAILPDHVHVLIRKHRDAAEVMIAQLQEASRRAVRQCRPDKPEHPVWGGPGWKVFLDDRDDMTRTVNYIRKNQAAAWPFVSPYDGWLPGQVCVVRRAPRREDVDF